MCSNVVVVTNNIQMNDNCILGALASIIQMKNKHRFSYCIMDTNFV